MKFTMLLILLLASCGKQTKTKTELVEVAAPKAKQLECNVFDLGGAVPSVMPNFSTLSSLGIVEVESLNNAATNNATAFPMLLGTKHESLLERFGLVCEGKLNIELTGSYIFSVNSDDGSKLFINGIQVVTNDGSHAMTKKSGTIVLLKGVVNVKIEYFNGNGDKGLVFSMKRPNVAFEELVKF